LKSNNKHEKKKKTHRNEEEDEEEEDSDDDDDDGEEKGKETNEKTQKRSTQQLQHVHRSSLLSVAGHGKCRSCVTRKTRTIRGLP
jgi:hypothetical protein